jgi:hypothetical protein
MVAVLRVIDVVLLAICCEQRSMKEYPSCMIEKTLPASQYMDSVDWM